MNTVSTLIPSIVAVLGLLGMSAFFSSSESAIFSLPDEQVSDPGHSGTPAQQTLEDLRGNPHRLLVTLLVGNNLVNIALTSIVTIAVASFVPPGPTVLLATGLVSVLILVFGEIVPKSYGLGHATSWSLRVARPIATVEYLMGPLVAVFDLLTRRLTELIGGDQSIEKPYLEE